jgi:Ca2+-binding RTX toxin-like protein
VKIADIVVTDDALGANSFSLSGAHASAFSIQSNGSGGSELWFNGGADYESQSSYQVTVVAADASVAGTTPVSTAFTLAISDVSEGIVGTSGPDLLSGTSGPDLIDARAGSDLVIAYGGNDTIIGGSGADLVLAGEGNDIIIATIGDGNDAYDGGQGSDTYDLSQLAAATTVSLGTTIGRLTISGVGSASGSQIGSDTLLRIENVIGGAGNDRIAGDNEANVLNGGAGNDTISGAGGADTLIGGLGNDSLNGAAGSDVFVFAPGFGKDTISGFDFTPAGGQDLLDISAFGITSASFASRVVLADLGADIKVTIDGDANQTIALVNAQLVSNITQSDFILSV